MKFKKIIYKKTLLQISFYNCVRKLLECAKFFLKHIFPNHCISCSKIINQDLIFCLECLKKLEKIQNPKCKICSYPFEFEIKKLPICFQCYSKKPSFDVLLSIFKYDKTLKEIISNFKYFDQTFLAKKLAKIMKEYLDKEIDFYDIITGVPLHPTKLRQRKFNQANLIAKNIEKSKFICDLIWKTKNTEAQVSMSKNKREKNLKNAFLVNKKYRNFLKEKIVVLVDDIATTKTTILNCSKALKKCGVKKIIVLTLAMTIQK